MNQAFLLLVLAGLDPAIHALQASSGGGGKGVDARHKAGHDDFSRSAASRLGREMV
jgi:hypothetical protein